MYRRTYSHFYSVIKPVVHINYPKKLADITVSASSQTFTFVLMKALRKTVSRFAHSNATTDKQIQTTVIDSNNNNALLHQTNSPYIHHCNLF